MGFWIRFAVITVGLFLFLLGIFKSWWEVKAWEVLTITEHRPPLINGSPRVHVRLFLVVAAVGLAMVILAAVPSLW